MAKPTDQQLDDDRLTEIAESHPGPDWYGGEWRTEYIESTEDEAACYVVKHQESGQVLAELPDFAGTIALFIADAHDAIPELVAEVRRLRAELATAPQHAYRVSEIRDNVVRRVHGYHASLEGAFAYCETEERKKPLIDSARFELFQMPGDDAWLIHSYYGPGDRCPETSDFVIRRVDVIPDAHPAARSAAV